MWKLGELVEKIMYIFFLIICFLLIPIVTVIFYYSDALETSLGGWVVWFGSISMIVYAIRFLLDKLNYTSKAKEQKMLAELSQKQVFNAYIIEFPFFGIIEDKDGKVKEIVSGDKVYEWFNKSTIDSISRTCEKTMFNSITEKSIKDKLVSMYQLIDSDGKIRLFINIATELNSDEKAQLLKLVSDQVHNDFGKNKFSYKDTDNNHISYTVSFWQKDNWYIKYVEEDLFNVFYEEYKRTISKECYSIELLDSVTSFKSSKIGGEPYLPVGEEYPTDSKGNPLHLLLQLNLNEVELPDYPSEGMLEVFTSAQQNVNGQLEYCIKYFPDISLQYHKEFPALVFSDEFKVNYFVPKAYSIKLVKTIEYMSMQDFRYPISLLDIVRKVYNLSDPSELYIMLTVCNNRLSSLVSGLNTKISFGGYADFAKEDPRKANNTISDKTECIFKLNSLYNPEIISLGNNGILCVLISKADLKNKMFNDAYIHWDFM